jgi:hypothetical protein
MLWPKMAARSRSSSERAPSLLAPADELLAAVSRRLPATLITVAARRRLRARAAQIPGSWLQCVVECRLHEHSDQVDLQVCAARGDGAQPRLLGLLRGRRRRPRFGRVDEFVRAWATPGTRLHRHQSAMWLEYDLPADRPPPEPLTFVALDPRYLDYVRERAAPRPSPPWLRAWAGCALGCLGSGGDDALEWIEGAAAALPAGGRLFHVVPLGQRGGAGVRLGAIVPVAGVRAWLAQIGWAGPAAHVERLCALVGPGARRVHVQVERAGTVRPRLAFDFQESGLPATSAAWLGLVARLRRARACADDKLAAAIAWPGHARARLPSLRGDVAVERLLFFKLTIDDGGALEVKAYLWFGARPWSVLW